MDIRLDWIPRGAVLSQGIDGPTIQFDGIGVDEAF